MQLIINSNIDYNNHVRSLAKKYSVSKYELAKWAWISNNTVKRIFTGINEKTGKQYSMWVNILSSIIDFFQEKTGEGIIIAYPELNTNSEQVTKGNK